MAAPQQQEAAPAALPAPPAAAAAAADRPGKCQMFLEKKRRHCKFDAVPGKRFCGNHMFEGEGTGPRRVPCPWDPKQGHTVLESELEKHKNKCPSYKHWLAERAQPCYVAGINAGAPADAAPWPEGLAPLPAPPRDAAADAASPAAAAAAAAGGEPAEGAPPADGKQRRRQRGPSGVAALQAAYAASLGEARFEELLGRIEAACAQICEAEPLSVLVPPAAEPLLLPESATHNRPFSLKHAQQQASIVGNMQAQGLLEGAAEVTYVEYGAGKGYLSQMLGACTDASRIVMMDVRGFKQKADRGMRHLEMQRLRCDIADFDVAQVEGLQGGAAPWVAFGKHLCGAATDFTLRSCARELQRRRGPAAAGAAAGQRGGGAGQQAVVPARGGVRGLAVATCCHHRCSWQHFVAKQEMADLGFTPLEFEVIAWLTGWALCGHEVPAGFAGSDAEEEAAAQREGGSSAAAAGAERASAGSEPRAGNPHKRGREEADQPAGLPPAHAASGGPEQQQQQQQQQQHADEWRPQWALPRERKIAVGQRCKRLIDAARLRWLRRQGFEAARLVKYVSSSVSGENRLLLAGGCSSEAPAPAGHP